MVSISRWTQEKQTQETNICTCSTQVICNLPHDSRQKNAVFSFLNLFKPSLVFSSKETKIPTSLFSQQKQRRNKESDALMLCWFSQFPSRVLQIVQTGFEHECISFCSLLYKCNPACRVQGFTLSPMMGFGFKALPCLQ